MTNDGGSWVPGKTDALLLTVTAVAEEGTSRSPLGIWMARNHGALSKAWGGKRLNWERLAREFAHAGLLKVDVAAWDADRPEDRQVRQRAAASAKRTWHRVCGRKGKPVVAPVVSVAAPQVATSAGGSAGNGPDADALLARLGGQVAQRKGG